MTELTKKQLRIVDSAVDRLFGLESFLVPKSVKDYSVKNTLSRELRLTDNRTIFLTDAGLAHMRRIVATIDDADAFDGMADYSDISMACRHILEDLLSQGKKPDNAAELLELMHELLSTKISNHTFAVPLFGIEMDGIDSIPLGSMKVVRPSVSHLDTAGVKHEHTDFQRTIEATKPYLWLLGSAKGTPQVALEKFRGKAELAAGMLAVSAASMYERGASAFRIGTIMSPEQAYGPAAWISWNDRNLEVTTHYKFVSSQSFKVNSSLGNKKLQKYHL